MFDKSFQCESRADLESFVILRGGPGTKAEEDTIISIFDYDKRTLGNTGYDTVKLSDLLYMVKMLGAEEVHLMDLSCSPFHPSYFGYVEDFKLYGGKTRKKKLNL